MVSCSNEWKHCDAVDWICEMVCLKQIWQLDVVPSQVCWSMFGDVGPRQLNNTQSKVMLVVCGIDIL